MGLRSAVAVMTDNGVCRAMHVIVCNKHVDHSHLHVVCESVFPAHSLVESLCRGSTDRQQYGG